MTSWLNGEWIKAGEAGIGTTDRGLLLGDGLFETLRLCGGELVRAAAHERRLRASCEALGLACPLDGISLTEVAAERAAHAEALDEEIVRMTGHSATTTSVTTTPTTSPTSSTMPPSPTAEDVIGALRVSADSAAAACAAEGRRRPGLRSVAHLPRGRRG